MVGDLVGSPGRAVFKKHIAHLMKTHTIDALIVNGENSAHGRGITSRIAQFFKEQGVHCVTTGNHVWHHKDIYHYLQLNPGYVLRPDNFPGDCPGSGVTTFTLPQGTVVGVLNLQGRIFMREQLSCPFRAADSALTFLRAKASVIVVDMHAEATSEKLALAYYLDGRVSAIVGTHTHVQTADERILPKGTAYLTDLGMGGALHSMIGMKKEPIIQNFLTQMPVKFTVETEGPLVLSGAVISIDTVTGKALNIKRIYLVDDGIVPDIHED